jgi:signal transduction histidine kinase
MTRMRIVAAVIAAAVAAALLAWAITGVQDGDRGWAMRADHAIDRFALGDRALQGDLLSARAGILRDYDPLNRDANLTHRAVQDIIAFARTDPALSRAARALSADLDARENLVERFKTDNALLQNSLARFASLSITLNGSSLAGRVTAAILELTLNTRPDAVNEASESLAAIDHGAQAPPWLHTHGDLLIRLLPEVDGILASIRAAPVEHDAAEVRRLIIAHEAADVAARVRRRVLFTAGVMLAAGLLGVLAFGLYARDRDLRRQAENERLSATVSSLLIEAQPHDLAERVERVLQQMAQHMGCTSAYLGIGPHAFCWSANAAPALADWEGLAALAGSHRNWQGHVLTACHTHGVDDALMGALADVGKRCLILIRAQADDGAVLGFAAPGSAPVMRADTVAGLLAALAAIRATVERHRLEGERIRLERRLALAQRMETVGAVASGVAHNFNNIIGAISGFSEMAELHIPRESKAVGDLAEIRQAVGRAHDLVEQILSFGRRGHGEEQSIELEDLIGETVRMLRVSLPRGVALKARLEPVGGEVRGDPAQVQQALMNICNNAAHVQGGKGDVAVRLQRCELRQRRTLSHGALEPGVFAVISVEDGGPGISRGVLGRIFEPFFTTRRGGTGLGLSTAWEITQAYGGSIDVQSEPGRGAVFSIWLPVVAGRAAAGHLHDQLQAVEASSV